MSKCKFCSAPLPIKSSICSYCDSKNPLDFNAVEQFTSEKPLDNRFCPHCRIPMLSINIHPDSEFYIERCPECYGLFFDPHELELLMDKFTEFEKVSSIDLKKYNEENSSISTKIKYIRCPVCGDTMQRKSYGYRSGVIIDRCAKHGIFLDAGEFSHLVEWKKSGGEVLAKKYEKRKVQEKLQRKRDKEYRSNLSSHYGYEETDNSGMSIVAVLLSFLRFL